MNHTKEMNAEVVHEADQQRFSLSLGEHVAELTYSLQGQQIDFNHTYVPFGLRGKGYAEKLVDAGLAWAKSNDYTICASCSYVQRFLTN
jgi:predicted GNAT family acetyltransferase